MEPICAAPSAVMEIVEQRAISLAARIGGRLTNIGKGGERIGDGYLLFLYYVHNDIYCDCDCN